MTSITVETNSRKFIDFAGEISNCARKICGSYINGDDGDLVSASIHIWLKGDDEGKMFPGFVFLYDREGKFIKVNDEKINYEECIRLRGVKNYGLLPYLFNEFINECIENKLNEYKGL